MKKSVKLIAFVIIICSMAFVLKACGGGGGGIPPVQPPSGLAVNSISATAVQLSWDTSTGVSVEGYKVYRNGLYVSTATSPSFTDTALTGNTQYCYEITAYEATGRESSHSNSVCDWTYAWVVSASPSDPRIYNIAYGKYPNYPQYAALATYSSYFRMIYGKDATWGTSVILFPVFWSGGLHQSTSITADWHTDGNDLVINSSGTLAGLSANIALRLSPPANNIFTATVNVTTTGSIVLDSRPGEAFKPVMLSSMNISPNYWDTQYGYVGTTQYGIPSSGWIISPTTTGSLFGLKGGTSSALWEPNKPTIEISLDRSMQVTGWVTASTNFNDDNVGFWAATDTVLPSWQYTITAKQ